MSSTNTALAAGATPPFFPDILGTEIVQLSVGPQKKIFRVHKALLCQKIPYFEKMFRGGFKEAEDNAATFPEDTVDSFAVLIEWVYTGDLRPLRFKSATCKAYDYDPVRFYFLVEKMCLFELMDMLMNFLRVHHVSENVFEALYSVQLAYENTDPKSPIRRYLVDCIAFIFAMYKNDEKNWPTQGISDLLVKNEDFRNDFMAKVRGISVSPSKKLSDPRRTPNCDYHHHGKDEVCPIKKAT